MANQASAFIIGAGDGTGEAIARRCAAAGLAVCLVRRDRAALDALVSRIRDSGGDAHGFCLDVLDETALEAALGRAEDAVGPVELAVYNVPVFIKGTVLDLSLQQYQAGLGVAVGGLVAARAVGRRMLSRGQGTFLFTGSTASLRGSAGFAAMAGGRHALRSLAQSMARELAPQGIHVAHLVLDGAIDTPALRAAFPDALADRSPDSLLSPEAIAEACWQLHTQPRSAWTQELVLRPWQEKW